METKRSTTDYTTAYNQLKPFWTDCLNLKEPLPFTLPLYLTKYSKEDASEFAERVKRLAQVNFVDIITDIYLSMLFSTTVQIDSVDHQEEVKAFVENCNPQGDHLVDYFREVIGPNALLFGVTDVFVDLPSANSKIISLAHQKEEGVQPYCYIVPCLNRIRWVLDDAKRYVEYQSVDVIDTQLSAGIKPSDPQQHTLWTCSTVARYRNGDWESDSPNTYGFIPAVTVIPLPSQRFYSDRLGISLVQDIVPLQKLVLNLISLILDFHENVNFATRVLVQDTKMGDEPPTQGELAEGGNRRGIILRGEGSDLKLVTPDAGGVESMRAFLCEIIERIYQCALLPSDANLNKTHQSGNTIRQNQAQLYNRLTRITKHFSKAMKQIVDMALRVQGIDPAKAGVTVRWDNNFSYEAFISAIEQLTKLKETMADMSPTAVREYAKNVINPQLYNSGKVAEINAELDKWTGVQPQTVEEPTGAEAEEPTEDKSPGEEG